jgi:hypothetical protein
MDGYSMAHDTTRWSSGCDVMTTKARVGRGFCFFAYILASGWLLEGPAHLSVLTTELIQFSFLLPVALILRVARQRRSGPVSSTSPGS